MSKLDKEICRRCINEWAKNENSNLCWSDGDDLMWENEEVSCPYMEDKDFISSDDAHNDCPYLLEHLLITQGESQ